MSEDSAPREKSRYSMHFERFILSVDNQRKASFTERDSAMAAGERLVKSFPVVRVVVIDQVTGDETVITPKAPGEG